MTTRGRLVRALVCLAVVSGGVVSAGMASLGAQGHAPGSNGRFLAREDILLFGLGLHVECNEGELPDENGVTACQTVPKGYSTALPTMFVAPQVPDALPGFGADAVIRGTLRGPSFPTPIELTAAPNTPFTIPPMSVPGLHSVDDIRLVVNGEVLLRGDRESALLRVIDKLLVTQVTARALTAEEERAKGLVFDRSNFQAYNFAAAFAIQDRTVPINFTVVLPSLQGASAVDQGRVTLPSIGSQPGLPSLQTVVPDSLKALSLEVPNLSVAGFSLKIPDSVSQNFYVPPIPGVVVIPGDIGFLNQFFSVMLMVGNVAPAGSGLVVSDLSAEIVLPPDGNGVADSPHAPLAMGRTDRGESARTQPVTQPGSDGTLGTADDIRTVGPGETGHAEFLVEGRREGTHVVEMRIAGTLHGLPIGPVPVTGIARGAVLVRNPTFTLTFTHPEVVSSGEPYSLDVTITNTSQSPANFVSLNLFPRFVTGATIVGEPTRDVESISPGDSATVSFDLIAQVSGKVTAATFDADGQVAGRFVLKTAVGELGIPVSPDSLVLPKEAASLDANLRSAAVGLLGKAWSVATAPAAALPPDVARFSKKVVIDRAIEVAEAGFRRLLREPEDDNAAQLLMDFAGSNFARLPDRTTPEELPLATADYTGFDEIRRRSVRGDTFAAAVAALLQPALATLGTPAFHEGLARRTAYRPPAISVLVTSNGGPLPVSLTLTDGSGRALGGGGAPGKVLKEIPFGDYLSFKDPSGVVTGQMALVAAPVSGNFTVQLARSPDAASGATYTLSLVIPDATGLQQFVFSGVGLGDVPQVPDNPANPYRLSVQVTASGVPQTGPDRVPVVTAVPDLAPSLVGVVQQAAADQVCVDPGKSVGRWRPGRVIAVLFSEEVTAASVQDKLDLAAITNYALDDNQVVGIALQPGGRIAMIALRDPVGPFIPRSITIENVEDLRGHVMGPETQAIETTVVDPGGVVSGRILKADGSPVPFASLRLFYPCEGGDGKVHWIGISQKSADAAGHYQWDYVLGAAKVLAVDPETEDNREVQFRLARNGQRLNVDLVMLGRGTVQGRTLDEEGQPLADSYVKITSLTDQSQHAGRTDASGRFTIARVPVGALFIEAVNTTAQASFSVSDVVPFAGATVTSELVLLRADSPAQVTIKRGTLGGHVVRTDLGSTANLPVVLFYRDASQPGVRCPPANEECAIATGTTDADGNYLFANVPAGGLHVRSFDQATFQQGDATTVLAPDTTASLTVILAGGLGIINGVVLDPDGQGVAGARVGGGYSLAVTDATGHFTLTDVPLGRRTITAVSDALQSTATAEVDLVRAGEEVPLTLVLNAYGTVAGTISRHDGTPAANVSAYLFRVERGRALIVGQAVSSEAGQYTINAVPLGDYTLSAFRGDFSDGNLVPVAVTYNQQIVKADVRFLGGNGGRVTGTIVDADGQTPLKGRVSISGRQPVIAGGRVAIRFDYVQNYQIRDTDLSGAFTLSGIWPGEFTVRAAGVFSPDPISLVDTMPAPTTTIAKTIRLEATSSVAGRVYQPDGVTPVGEGVLIKYKSTGVQTFCHETSLGERECVSIPKGIQELNAVTQTDGTFLLPVVTAGPFTLTIADNTGHSAHVRATVRAGERAELTPRLLGLSDVHVRVFTSDLQPVPGARVTIQAVDDPDRVIPPHDADASGIARFAGGDALAEGAFVVKAEDLLHGGAAGRASGRVVTEGATVVVDVYLFTQVGSVSGTVYRADGAPAPNAQVIISTADGPLTFSVTDSDGAYRLEQIPVDKPFTVEAFDPVTAARGSGTGTIFLPGQDIPLNIHEDAPAVVGGTLVDVETRAPLKGWQVTLSQTTPSGASRSLVTTTAIDGGFSFPGAAVGPFTLRATKATVLGAAHATGTVDRPGQAVDVILVATLTRPAYGRITGVVVHPDGSPAGDTQVDICLDSCAATFATVAGDATTGEFALDNVPLARVVATGRTQDGLQSGTAIGQITFDGETIRLVVVLAGLSQVTGTVTFADGTPAAHVNVVLTTAAGARHQSANDSGVFTFSNVSARAFSVVATDPVSLLKGAASDLLNPGESREVQIVLQPTGSVIATVQLENGNPAVGVAGEIVIGTRRFFAQSGANGTVTFDALPMGSFRLTLEDPVGIGIASRRGTVAGPVDLGNVRLDSSRPVVASITPAPGSTGAPNNSVVRIVFSEPMSAASVNGSTVTVSDATGLVQGTVTLSDGDTTVTFDPVSALHDQTQYNVRVTGVRDVANHTMAADYVTSFTTADIVAPTVTQYDPAPGTSGAHIYAPVRIVFSEPIDVARFRGPPSMTLAGPAGPVAGRVDFILGNTVAVFTPNLPLLEQTVYQLTAPAAFDLAGNQQAQATALTFSTTDRTPPTISALTAANNGVVIENTVMTVQATVSTTHDVSFVDFYLNGVFKGTAPAPYVFAFQAVPELAAPGSHVLVGAVATDTSGNRGLVPATTQVAVVADTAPTLTIAPPAGGGSAANGQRVDFVVTTGDDVGIQRVGFRALTGDPRDAAEHVVTPAVRQRSDTFGFNVPNSAQPGSTIEVRFTVVDTKGQATSATATIEVLDAVAPAITVTGASSGTTVSPGQQATIVVTAQDIGGVASITLRAGGVTVVNQTRPIDPPQNSVVTTFNVTVPASAQPPQSLTIDVSAVDRAGNVGNAPRVILPVADTNAPTITSLRTSTGALQAVAGTAVTVVVDATDDIGVSRVDLAGSGAFTVSEGRQLVPPLAAGTATFTMEIPAAVAPGSILTLTATATDLADNVGLPASLALTIMSAATVTLPPSILLDAGQSQDVTVQLSAPAPAGGAHITFTSNAAVATVTPSVTIAEGQTTGTLRITGAATGTTGIDARIDNVLRGSMTATVAGGIVRGTVRDTQLAPVADATVVVSDASHVVTTETDANGQFSARGLSGPSVSIRAFKDIDPTTRLLGFASAQLNRTNGFAAADLVLIAAGMIRGTVTAADGVTPAGAGVEVDLFESTDAQHAITTTFTDQTGHFEFPLVAMGQYVVVATQAATGARGRATVALTTSGQEVDLSVLFLGSGTVTVTVRDGAGAPVNGADLTLHGFTVFGPVPPVTRTSGTDGRASFPNVTVGTFRVDASDPVTARGGSISGEVLSDQQVVERELTFASYGTVTGTVFRADGVATVPGATVTLNTLSTVSDSSGGYAFAFVPLGPLNLSVRDDATRGQGTAAGSLTQHGSTQVLNVTMLPQGSLVVTVRDANGTILPGAQVNATVTLGAAHDSLSATAGDNGTVLFNYVLAGTFTIDAKYAGLTGRSTGTLTAGEQRGVTVHLQPTAGIAGLVTAPNDAPVTEGTVSVDLTSISVPIQPDGTYRIDGLPLGTYRLTARDANNRVRARSAAVPVLIPNQAATANFKFVGLGSVTGRVLNPDGSSAQGVSVQVRALNPDFGSYASTSTNAGGFYTVSNLAVGRVTVSASNTTLRLRAEGEGTVESDGDLLTIDLLLQNNLIDLPASRWDASNFLFDIQRDGSIRSGTSTVFAGNAAGGPWGASSLEVVANGTPWRFTGDEFGTTEDGAREIAVRQDDVAGLSVTRKIFVPAAGYFTRYLETLTNPSDQPITVDVRVLSHLRQTVSGANGTAIIATSSGDAALDVSDAATADQWVTADDQTDTDPFLTSSLPATAFVFDGAGGTRRAGQTAFGPVDPEVALSPRRLIYGWNAVTIEPGQAVTFMHFAVQQVGRAWAQASAERLVQLPPEALTGLNGDEIASIQNFAMPQDGSSPLAPLPPVIGHVSGRVLASNGTTPVATQVVRFRSAHPLFGRTWQTPSAVDGRFSLTGALAENGTSRPIPLAPFTLVANHPVLGATVASPEAAGQFADGASVAQQDVVFANTGIARGTLSLDGTPLNGVTVSAQGLVGSTNFNLTTTTAADGSFTFAVTPAVAVTFGATVSLPAVGSRTLSTVVAVGAGALATPAIAFDTLAPTVAITAPAGSATIDPRAALPVTVSVADQGGVTQIALQTSGLVTFSETRAVAPAATAGTESFSVPFATLPATGGTLTLTAVARDGQANQASASPVTVTVLDVVAPELVSVTPPAGATGVAPTATLALQFSEPVARASITAASVSLLDGSTVVPVTVTFGDNDRRVTLTPVATLAMNRTFTIGVTTAVTDVNGNALPAPASSTFRTQSPDTIPPRVAGTDPLGGAVNVPVSTPVTVTFTEPIDRSTITAASFALTINGAPIAGHFAFSDGDAVVRFVPAAPLPFDAIAVVQLSAAITDMFENSLVDATGDPLTTPLTFTFATGTFGITRPTHGTGVLERTTLTIEASATAALNIATVVFTVNGQALPAVVGPPYVTTYNVGAAATTASLTIAASGRNAGGTEVATDQIEVPVAASLRASPRLLGVPVGGAAPLRLILPAPLATDTTVQLAAVDPAIASPVEASIVIPAGQMEATIMVTGLQVGATTIAATSTRGVAWAVASVSTPVSKPVTVHALPALTTLTPLRTIGRMIVASNGAQTAGLPLLPGPAGLDTPVTITSSDPAVANVATSVVIPQGSRTAEIPVTTGEAGAATLTLEAGGTRSLLTVLVGPPFDPLIVAPVTARAVGVNVLAAPSLGRLVRPEASQGSVTIPLLQTPASSTTPVTVTSSDPSIVQVAGTVSVAAGSQSATIDLQTGAAGTATLTFAAGGYVSELTVIVGMPPPGTLVPLPARPVAITVLPPLSIGRVTTPTAGQTTIVVPLLSTPAAAATPVTVTSSNPAVVSIDGPLTVPAGAVGVTVTLQASELGHATLTFAVGSEVRELSVIVGTPPPDLVPAVVARPVGVLTLPVQSGRVFTPVGGQAAVDVPLLVTPAGTVMPVAVTTSDASVANVAGSVVVAQGATAATLHIVTGDQGVATLQVTAGDQTREIQVVVGTPPPGLAPVVVAPVVGVQVQ